MDRLIEKYRQIIKDVLSEYLNIDYSYGDIKNEAIFDDANNRYIILSLGWQKNKRIHGCLIHVDIIDDKIWIQRDGTEDGIAYELEKAGIPKKQMVLGFHDPDVRKYTDYALC